MSKILKKVVSTPIALSIIFGISVLSGGIVLWKSLEKNEDIPFFIETKPKEESGEIEINQELINKIISEALPANYDKDSAVSSIQDLNGDELEEVIISATAIVPPQDLPHQAYIVVVTPLDNKGNFERIADFYFGQEETIVFRSTPRISTLINNSGTLDIEGDGEKEIILDLGTGGASNEAYGIFKVDWNLGEMTWLKIKSEDGIIENTYFLAGGSVMHQESFYFEDIDQDGVLEMIEKLGSYKEAPLNLEEGGWSWQILVYKWDGLIFSYNKELSESENEAGN